MLDKHRNGLEDGSEATDMAGIRGVNASLENPENCFVGKPRKQ
jgi:hypothetical protein